MSHYLHHVIEYQKDGKWVTFKLLSKPDVYSHDRLADRIFKIPGDDQEYYWENEFTTSYLSLRDNYFGSNPWAGSGIFSGGVPENASDESKEILKEWVEGHFRIYNCTLAELTAESNKVFAKWRAQTKHNDIMDYSVEFVKRLGYGKENSEYIEDPDETEELEEKLIIYNQFNALVDSIQSMIEFTENEYWFDSTKIRILIWTD